MMVSSEISWCHDSFGGVIKFLDPPSLNFGPEIQILGSKIQTGNYQFLVKFHEKLQFLGFSGKSRKTRKNQFFVKFHEISEKTEKTPFFRKSDFPPPFIFFPFSTLFFSLSPPVQTKNGELKQVLVRLDDGEGASDHFWPPGCLKYPRKTTSKKQAGHG